MSNAQKNKANSPHESFAVSELLQDPFPLLQTLFALGREFWLAVRGQRRPEHVALGGHLLTYFSGISKVIYTHIHLLSFLLYSCIVVYECKTAELCTCASWTVAVLVLLLPHRRHYYRHGQGTTSELETAHLYSASLRHWMAGMAGGDRPR